MVALRENPFDPDEFGDVFAVALVPLCDPGTDIDLMVDSESADCVLTMGGVEYHITISAQKIDAPH